MPPASKANSRSGTGDPGASPLRSLLDVFLRRVLALVLELHLDDRVHRAGVGGVGGRQVGDHAELRDDNLQVARRSTRGRTARPGRSSSRSPRSACRWRRGRRSRRRRHRPRGRTRGAAGCPGRRASPPAGRRRPARPSAAVVHRADRAAGRTSDAGVDQGFPARSAAKQPAASRPAGVGDRFRLERLVIIPSCLPLAVSVHGRAGSVRPEPLGGSGRDERPREEVGDDHREGDGQRHRPDRGTRPGPGIERQRGEHQEACRGSRPARASPPRWPRGTRPPRAMRPGPGAGACSPGR